MSDLIDRQAAIDEIKALYEWHEIVTEDRAIEHFKRLPSAQPGEDIRAMCGECDAWNQYKNYPQPGWIPCSERMPEEDGQYLITVKYKHVNDSYEDIYTEHGEFYYGIWDMFCFGHCGEVEDILAWCELPEPWDEEKAEGAAIP